ncbi:conserved protein, unknown function [Hepatocystis sp. ex Piliocolobus tephrosceles]|nr:conserved protein, unknown function [Hepatocystis sp. ex Piliocolobus tephrosceles]
MNFNKINDKKRHLGMYDQDNSYSNFKTIPRPPMPNNPYMYSLPIPQYPFTPIRYDQNVKYLKVTHSMNNYNYNNKMSMRKKKKFHYPVTHHKNELRNLKETIVDPWMHLYGKYPQIDFD